MRQRVRVTTAAAAIATAIAIAGPTGTAAADGPTFPPRDERCKVPALLFPVAAEVDPDSLEGCGYFEDPNYHENRKQNGTYNPNGLFSILFG